MAPIQQSIHFFSKYGVTLTFLFILAGVGVEMVSINLTNSFELEAPWNEIVVSLIATGLFEPIASAAAIFFIASRDSGKNLSVYDCLIKALNVYSQMLVCYVATTLLIMFGLSFYIIPGIFLLYKLMFAEYFIILNEEEPMTAIQHSFERTEGKAMVLMPAFIIILMLVLGCNALIQGVVTSLGGESGVRVLGAIIEAPLLAFAIVVGYRLFSLTSDPISKTGI